MAGILSKLFTATALPKTSAAGYSIWIAVMTALLSGGVWLFLSLKDKATQPTGQHRILSFGIGALTGAINRTANFLLVLALLQVDASVQYPMVTGGTMIVSTVFSCFGKNKPSRRELMSVAFAFIGMLLLFL